MYRSSSTSGGGGALGPKRKSHSSSGRTKAASILMREEKKSDKRHAVAEALAAKLISKYAKQDAPFADSITSMTNRLLLHSHQRIVESDIVTLEAVVKKMSLERQSQRVIRSDAINRNGIHSAGGASHGHNSSSGSGRMDWPYDNSSGNGPNHKHLEVMSELQKQDEWVLLNALTLVEVDSEQERAKAKALEKRRLQRAWLDAQQAEKAAQRDHEQRDGAKHYAHQMQDVSSWRASESVKKQQQLEQVLRVRHERDEQLRQQKRLLDQAEQQRKRDEAVDVERVQRELQRQDADAQRRREVEHERMRKLQLENAAVQTHKQRVRVQEQADDVKLMDAYARRLAQEDEARTHALQSKLKQRVETQHQIAASIQAQMRQKTLDDERRADAYQRIKDDAAIQKEREAHDRRKKEALERQQFLHEQRAQKQQREHQEVVDDLTFAEQYHREGRAAVAAQKQQVQRVREQNCAFQEHLLVQMDEQRRGQPMSPLHLPRQPMNSHERRINAKLLQKLEQPDISQKVLEKLSPVRDMSKPLITTTFY